MESKMRNGLKLMLVAGLALTPAMAWAADGSFDKTLKVSGPVLLSVETGSGSIHISSGPPNEVHVVAHIHSNNSWGMGGGSSEDRIQQITSNPPIEQAGNIISIGKNMHVRNLSIDYDITTPRGTDLRADSGSGDLRIQDTGGPVEAKTGSGGIEGMGLSDRVSLETGSGDIRATMLSALDVKAQTGSGSIELKNVQSGLWAHTGSGDLRISGKPLGAWKLETGSGSVSVDTGGSRLSLDADTGSGDIHTNSPISTQGTMDKHHMIGDVNGGGAKVKISTGSGDISVR